MAWVWVAEYAVNGSNGSGGRVAAATEGPAAIAAVAAAAKAEEATTKGGIQRQCKRDMAAATGLRTAGAVVAVAVEPGRGSDGSGSSCCCWRPSVRRATDSSGGCGGIRTGWCRHAAATVRSAMARLAAVVAAVTNGASGRSSSSGSSSGGAAPRHLAAAAAMDIIASLVYWTGTPHVPAAALRPVPCISRSPVSMYLLARAAALPVRQAPLTASRPGPTWARRCFWWSTRRRRARGCTAAGPSPPSWCVARSLSHRRLSPIVRHVNIRFAVHLPAVWLRRRVRHAPGASGTIIAVLRTECLSMRAALSASSEADLDLRLGPVKSVSWLCTASSAISCCTPGSPPAPFRWAGPAHCFLAMCKMLQPTISPPRQTPPPPQVGVLVGSVVAMLFNLLPESALHSWGWRVPFLLSIAGSAVGYYIRRCAVENGRVRPGLWGLQAVLSRAKESHSRLYSVLGHSFTANQTHTISFWGRGPSHTGTRVGTVTPPTALAACPFPAPPPKGTCATLWPRRRTSCTTTAGSGDRCGRWRRASWRCVGPHGLGAGRLAARWGQGVCYGPRTGGGGKQQGGVSIGQAVCGDARGKQSGSTRRIGMSAAALRGSGALLLSSSGGRWLQGPRHTAPF